MLGGQHRHFVRVGRHLHVGIVTDHWLHWLLIIVTTVVTVHLVVSDVDHTGALAELAAVIFHHLVFVERRSAVVHFGQASSLSARLRDCSIAILILLVHQIDRWLNFFIGVRVDLYFV